jgi:hypothetical protein
MSQFSRLFLIAILFSSCYRNIFLPSAPYAPQLKEKGEVEFAAGANVTHGVQVQGAWAMTRHFGVQAQANAISAESGNVLFGPHFRLQYELDSVSAFLFGFSAGYSGGMHTRYVTREAGDGVPGITTQPGYMLYDMAARWQGGYFQFSYGGRVSKRFSFYGGARFQWLKCDEFHYQTQFFTYDSTGTFTPGQTWTVNPSHGHTTIVDNFVGARFGWRHFQFFLQGQWRYQYNGWNLNDTYKKTGTGTGTVGVVFLFGGK